ncbi:MAG TPA: DNA-directed RNA polymerase subunit beta [Candidatus Saccharimonadales bacterium]|nr:DNA-directed RNA polymerase subunit beta [Candidatus Saccharimonadales bacterium]
MRHDFSKRKITLPLPNLSSVQLDSFQWFKDQGINEILDELGMVEDYSGRGWILTLSKPTIEKENLSVEQALHTGRTYDAPWYLTATLEDRVAKKDKKQVVYMGDLPLMTEKGTFIVNGVERVIVNQLIRSEGVLFTGVNSPITGQFLAGAKVLPKNGVWLEIETARSGVISVKIDRKRKITITTLLRVFGLETDEDIRDAFTSVETNPEMNYIDATLAKDPASSYNEACIEIYRKMRPGDPLVLDNAKALVDSMFFNKRRYSLGEVGRFKMNQVLGLNFPNDPKHRLLQLEDLLKIISNIVNLNNGIGEISDIDHLANRRIKSIGELLQNQMRVGFLQLEKNIKEKMSLQPRETLPEPSLLVSPRIVAAKIHSFFASGQLSQMQDQQNPLISLDHLRRLSVLGPGGLTKERASMAVRDVHYSSFGRICPVRTPEGPSIGLINYLAMYAKVNKYGFLETPYYKLEKDKDGRTRMTDEIVYLAAYDEELSHITDASVDIDDKGYIIQKQVPLRSGGHFSLGDISLAEYMEVVPRQVVGISAGLIPFLSNDDVARALMGTQQMSQAVPLVKPEAPLVGTGIEEAIARNANAVCVAEAAGEVTFADASVVKVSYDGKKPVEYHPAKFLKSNSDTCYNQYVRVSTGQKVKKGDILIEGPAVDNGEISIGTNVTVAYMIWEGYEFEDGIVLSDRLVKEDILTSIHISDYEISVLETKLGNEEITSDIPNASEDSLRNLAEDGIVAIGSKVKSGDILVGKVAPKGEADLSAEERLLRAIFGEKAKDVRDNSLVMPHGEHGVVIGVKRVTKKENDQLPAGVLEEITVYVAQQKKIEVGDKLAGRHGNKGVISAIVPSVDMPHLVDGTPIDIVFSSEAVLKRMNVGQIQEAPLGMAAAKLGKKYLVPTLEKVPQEEIDAELNDANVPLSGKMDLIDGRTGEYFAEKVVVGKTYILKLVHMSEEKMHARSTGPYSLITQQPLGGKAQFGGQRFGEMEVWALEAYGAAHILKEMLTIKSDDLVGRTQAYSAIIQGKTIPESNVPETFKLLVRELNGLGLGMEALASEAPAEPEQDAVVAEIPEELKEKNVVESTEGLSEVEDTSKKDAE